MTLSTPSRPISLARSTVWNIVGQLIPLVVAVATLPYVVRGLGPERFGMLSIAWLLLGYLALLDFGLGRAATKFIAEYLARGECGKLQEFLWTSLALQVGLGCCGGLLLALLAPVLVGTLFHVPVALSNEARQVLSILSLSLPVVLATNGLRAALEAGQRFDLVNLLKVPASISIYVLPAVGVRFRASLVAIVLLMLSARLLTGLAHLMCCLHIFPSAAARGFAISRSALAVLLPYGGWVTLSNLANPLLVYIDRLFIASLLSLSLLGSYTVPFEAVTKLWIVPASLASTLFPAFSSLSAEENRSRTRLLYVRSFKYLLLLLGPVVLLLVLFAKDILQLWMGDAFARQTTIVFQILAGGVFVNCFAHIPFGLLQSRGRPDLAAKVLLVELPLYLPLAWCLVKRWGIQGAATGWTIRVLLEAILLAVLASRAFALAPALLAEHGVRKGLLGICTLGVMFATSKILLHDFVLAQVSAVIVLTAAYCALVWHKILDGADRGQVHGILLPLANAAKG